ncbi:MAG: glycoside hydrolase family 2 TIM barrel-domain containing protein [Bacteroidota bacterium]
MNITRILFGVLLAVVHLWPSAALGQTELLQNAYHRTSTSLDGKWHYIVDPYETGYRNHRNFVPFDERKATISSAKSYASNAKPQTPIDRVEYDFDASPTLNVPGDWNHQRPELLYYEGSVWYKTEFQYDLKADRKLYLYFGGANYRADVYLNGTKLGFHEGGYDPFNFDITDVLRKGENDLVVRIDNRRTKDRVPNMATDWWNYGGITRSVKLIELPATFIQDYYCQLSASDPEFIEGYVQLSEQTADTNIQLSIPEANLKTQLTTNAQGKATFRLKAKGVKQWYPERPKLYQVNFSTKADTLVDRIGFRHIQTRGKDILLNGKSVFLRGLSLHEENPLIAGRVTTEAEARMLFNWAKELNCNFVRLAHYPHNEHMPRLADELGFLLWEEVPVYWGINYTHPPTYLQAENQVKALVHRDKNRASVIVWSVANETPREDEARLVFLEKLAQTVRDIDSSRMVSAALDRTEEEETHTMYITDPFAKTADLISCNEYIGWYGSTPEQCAKTTWDVSSHDKPFFISEFGAGALYNYHGPQTTRWTEEYQAWMYRETLDMLEKIPSLRGMTPWILVDFRSPRRNLAHIQDGWNRKGVISDRGFKKQAFYVLKAFYDRMEKKHAYVIED